MANFQRAAGSVEDVASHLGKVGNENQSGLAEDASVNPEHGIAIAPGVRFSDRLWARLGAQNREQEKQSRREKLSETTAFPELATSIFDPTFRKDAIWKRRELNARKAHIEHVESLILQRDVEKELLQEKLAEQVTGVYKLSEDESVQKLSSHVKDFQARTYRVPTATPACSLEREATLACYNSNASNPLLCAAMVSTLEKCANNVRLEILRKQQALSAKA